MESDLVKYREYVMDRADRAVDASWPARLGADYVYEMQWAASELQRIADAMFSKKICWKSGNGTSAD